MYDHSPPRYCSTSALILRGDSTATGAVLATLPNVVANVAGTGFLRVPLLAAPIDSGDASGTGGEAIGELESFPLPLIKAGESSPEYPGESASVFDAGESPEGGITLVGELAACISESGSRKPLTFFPPIVLGFPDGAYSASRFLTGMPMLYNS